jgi:hypothetical protein
MADVMVGYPGASPTEVESRVAKRRKSSQILKGWTHSYDGYEWSGAYSSIYVGEDVERSYVKLYDELAKHEDMFPKGVYKPM